MKKVVFGLILALALGALSVSLAATQTRAATTIDIYAGELSGGTSYGFGNSSNNIASPGPTLYFKPGDSITVNYHNVGTMPHNFAIVSDKNNVNNVLWNSAIQSGSNPVSPGSTKSVTFTVGNQEGNYFYVCQVPGHVTLGMWGDVVVSNTVPEFSSLIAIGLMIAIVTAVAVYIAQIRKKQA